MKLFAFALAVFCIAALVDGSPVKKKAPVCDLYCPQDYNPVCAAPPNDKSVKPRLFGNACTVEQHNCENKSNWVVVSKDLCKNAGGVRLS